MMMELLAIRKFGLGAAIVNDKTGRPLVDNLGHLFGYVAGIGAGATIRSYDPYWKNLKRHHFFTRDFGKHDMQASVPKSPPPG